MRLRAPLRFVSLLFGRLASRSESEDSIAASLSRFPSTLSFDYCLSMSGAFSWSAGNLERLRFLEPLLSPSRRVASKEVAEGMLAFELL